MPFSHILRNYKLDTAAKLLEQTEQNLNSICDAIGYKDSTQFIRSFKNALARPLPNTAGTKSGKNCPVQNITICLEQIGSPPIRRGSNSVLYLCG
ncbi:MAG: helix-turn-helix domain-containing protein [Eubacteriales bacterium]|jgi:hypothetical protein